MTCGRAVKKTYSRGARCIRYVHVFCISKIGWDIAWQHSVLNSCKAVGKGRVGVIKMRGIVVGNRVLISSIGQVINL
jgi:hypothetical protein